MSQAEKEQNQKKFTDRRPAIKRAAELLPSCLSAICRKRGVVNTGLFVHWPDIVGPPFDSQSLPIRISWQRSGQNGAGKGTISLRCDSATAFLIAMQQEQIIEKINVFLGWQAIDRIKLIQSPLSMTQIKGEKERAELSPENCAKLQKGLDDIEHSGLRTALNHLGEGVYQQKR